MCVYIYKLADSDSGGDYYIADAESHWTINSGGADFPAAMDTQITSNIAAISNVYDATPTFTSTKACTSSLTVGFGFGPFSLSTTPQVCNSYKVTRSILGSSTAYWTSGYAGELRKVDVAFSEKVPQGAHPKFAVSFGIPRYTTVNTNGNWYTTRKLVYTDITLQT